MKKETCWKTKTNNYGFTCYRILILIFKLLNVELSVLDLSLYFLSKLQQFTSRFGLRILRDPPSLAGTFVRSLTKNYGKCCPRISFSLFLLREYNCEYHPSRTRVKGTKLVRNAKGYCETWLYDQYLKCQRKPLNSIYIKIEYISILSNIENNQDWVHKTRTYTMSVNFATIFLSG